MKAKTFFKPDRLACNQILYAQADQELDGLISIRGFDIDADTQIIYGWSSQAYATKFWSTRQSLQEMRKEYEIVIEDVHRHSFAVSFNDALVAEIELYDVAHEEIGTHLKSPEFGDAGLHFLGQPPKQSRKGLSKFVLQHFTHYYFSFKEAKRLYGEPDKENLHANKLALNAGFQFIDTLTLKEKVANLYCITRERYQTIITNAHA